MAQVEELKPQQGIYSGMVTHQRFHPLKHGFRYRVAYFFLNIKTIPETFCYPLFFFTSPFSLLSFQRRHYLGERHCDLYQEIQKIIKQQTSDRFSGDVFLLTNISYLGFCFNPVSFYYCYHQGRLVYIISEITNTPWNERHPKVFKVPEENPEDTNSQLISYHFKKDFHVSPFFPMEQDYHWRFSVPEKKLSVVMHNYEELKNETTNKTENEKPLVFQSTLNLSFKKLSLKNILVFFVSYPLLTFKTLLAIYWQAGLLYFYRKVPFYSHPKYRTQS